MIFFVDKTLAKIETEAIGNLLIFSNAVLEDPPVLFPRLSRDTKFVSVIIKIHAKKTKRSRTTTIDQ